MCQPNCMQLSNTIPVLFIVVLRNVTDIHDLSTLKAFLLYFIHLWTSKKTTKTIITKLQCIIVSHSKQSHSVVLVLQFR